MKAIKNSESSFTFKTTYLSQSDSLDRMVIAHTLSKSFFKTFIE